MVVLSIVGVWFLLTIMVVSIFHFKILRFSPVKNIRKMNFVNRENEIKALLSEVEDLLDLIKKEGADPRNVAIAKTELENVCFRVTKAILIAKDNKERQM